MLLRIAQIPLGSSSLDTTRHVRRVEHVKTRHHGSTHSIRLARYARLDALDTTSSTGPTRWSRRARHVERVVSRRDDPSGIWALWSSGDIRAQTSSAPSSRFSSCLSRCDMFSSRMQRITCDIIRTREFSITNNTSDLLSQRKPLFQPISRLLFFSCPL